MVFRRARRRTPWKTFVVAEAGNGERQSDVNDDDGVDDSVENEVSRRVFLAGVTVTGLFTLTEAVNLFGGDEFKRDVVRPFRNVLPFLFPKERVQPTSQRLPLHRDFVEFYFDSIRDISVNELHAVSSKQLDDEESYILNTSRSLFFSKPYMQRDLTDMTDPVVFDYCMYARLRAIATHTSPASRVKFSELLGWRSYRYIKTKCEQLGTPLPDPKRARREPKRYAEDWLLAIRLALATLVRLGWLSSYSVTDFDSSNGSMWDEEGRGELTVACNDPVTLGTAMLLGEEKYEEISPKSSALVTQLMIDYGVVNLTKEDYYMDLMFRPDPAMYKPRQIVTQFNFNTAA